MPTVMTLEAPPRGSTPRYSNDYTSILSGSESGLGEVGFGTKLIAFAAGVIVVPILLGYGVIKLTQATQR